MSKTFKILLASLLIAYTYGAFPSVTAECQINSDNLDTKGNQGCCGGNGIDNYNETVKCTPVSTTATLLPMSGNDVSTQSYGVKGSLDGLQTKNFYAQCNPTTGESDVTTTPYSVAAHCTDSWISCIPENPDTDLWVEWSCTNWGTSEYTVSIDSVDCETNASDADTSFSDLKNCSSGSSITYNT